MSRIYNFNAGPAVLPLEVIEEAQRELVDFQGTGMSLLESSHRAKAYDAVHNEAIANLRELMYRFRVEYLKGDVRDALVRANYRNAAAGILPDLSFAERFFDNLVNGADHELDREDLICPTLFESPELLRNVSPSLALRI